MTDWIEHNGGPQPVADDVWFEVLYPGAAEARVKRAGDVMSLVWKRHNFRWRILNQHLIDAARLEGIRLGLEAAHKAVEALFSAGDTPFEEVALVDASKAVRALNPDTIAREAVLDQLTREAQAHGMGYAEEAGQ